MKANLQNKKNSLETDNTELKEINTDNENTDLFTELAKKYTDFEELTPAMINGVCFKNRSS